MEKAKKHRLESAGWRIGTAEDFLGLTKEESEFVEMKLRLAQSLRQWRMLKRMTQAQLAKLIRSSQSRVAKMEAADPSVSVDLLMQSLIAIGATRKDLAKIISSRKRSAA
jgi:predicted XRE-type DNA-binding protein